MATAIEESIAGFLWQGSFRLFFFVFFFFRILSLYAAVARYTTVPAAVAKVIALSIAHCLYNSFRALLTLLDRLEARGTQRCAAVMGDKTVTPSLCVCW